MTATAHTIVYDWNGTLFNDAAHVCHCQSLIAESLGYPAISLDAFCAHYDWPLDRLFRGVGLSEDDVIKTHGLIMSVFHETYEPLADQTPLREGVSEFLTYAHSRGIRQVILSNHLIAPISRQLDRLGIAPLIMEILANTDREGQVSGAPKRDRLKQYMLRHLLAPERTIIVGDSPEETKIGRDLGLVCVSVTGGFVSERRLRVAEPDYIITSISEMPSILQARGLAA